MFRFLKRKNEDPDEMVLSQLAQANSNLKKPHKIDFFLYFPKEQDGLKAKELLQKGSRKIIVKKSAQTEAFVCQVIIEMIPEITEIKNIGNEFSNVASQLNGFYDGWGAEIEK